MLQRYGHGHGHGHGHGIVMIMVFNPSLILIIRAMTTLATWVTAPVADTESFERKARLLYQDIMIII